jgi:hypothetical protein
MRSPRPFSKLIESAGADTPEDCSEWTKRFYLRSNEAEGGMEECSSTSTGEPVDLSHSVFRVHTEHVKLRAKPSQYAIDRCHK